MFFDHLEHWVLVASYAATSHVRNYRPRLAGSHEVAPAMSNAAGRTATLICGDRRAVALGVCIAAVAATVIFAGALGIGFCFHCR